MKSLFVALLSLICGSILTLRAGASTIAVGSCDSSYPSYLTISEAVAAATPGSTILVCPGTYPEQVTITTPLTLSGLSSAAPPVIAVPGSGLIGPQVTVNGTDSFPQLFVTLSNLVVDGTGANGIGVYYLEAEGLIKLVEARNQYFGIALDAVDKEGLTVNVEDSYVHTFTNTGIVANDADTQFTVNVSRSLVRSSSAAVQAGIEYDTVDGTISQNYVLLKAGWGLQVSNFSTAGTLTEGNLIEGAEVGIVTQLDFENTVNTIRGNTLLNNATGISLFGIEGGDVVESNYIIQSSVEAIDMDCSTDSSVQYNIIYGTPVGIADIAGQDITAPNTFIRVGTNTTACP